MKVESNIKQISNSNGLYIVLGSVYFTYSMVYLPVQVKVLELNMTDKKARIEGGWIELDRLYQTEEDCPQR